MAPPAQTIPVALDMSNAFNTTNIHTQIRRLLQTNIPGTIINLIANYVKGREHIIETTHPDKANLEFPFHKVASSHPHYLIFTLQTYHHPVHHIRSWPTQTTSSSHPHTHARVQPRNTYKHKTQDISHPLHKHTPYFNTPRLKKHYFQQRPLHNNIHTDPHTVTKTDINTPPPHISSSEEMLPYITRRTLAQIRTNKYPFLKSYLHNVDAKTRQYDPSVTSTHIISSTAPTYAPRCYHWIYGQTLLK